MKLTGIYTFFMNNIKKSVIKYFSIYLYLYNLLYNNNNI